MATRYPVVHFYEKKRPFYEFTNLHGAVVVDSNWVVWPSSEHYFQAAKYSAYPAAAEIVRLAPLGMPVFTVARRLFREFGLQAPANWDHGLSKWAMDQALRAKFQAVPDIARMLLDTRTLNETIIEHTQNDRVWADGGDGKGDNRLGQALTELRDGFGDFLVNAQVRFYAPPIPRANVTLAMYQPGGALHRLRPMVIETFGTLVGTSVWDKKRCKGDNGTCPCVGNSLGLCTRHRCLKCHSREPALDAKGAVQRWCSTCAPSQGTQDNRRCVTCRISAPHAPNAVQCGFCHKHMPGQTPPGAANIGATDMCSKCKANPKNPRGGWCQSCFDNAKPSTLGAVMCKKCNKQPPNTGRTWCQSCFDQHAPLPITPGGLLADHTSDLQEVQTRCRGTAVAIDDANAIRTALQAVRDGAAYRAPASPVQNIEYQRSFNQSRTKYAALEKHTKSLRSMLCANSIPGIPVLLEQIENAKYFKPQAMQRRGSGLREQGQGSRDLLGAHIPASVQLVSLTASAPPAFLLGLAARCHTNNKTTEEPVGGI